MIDANFCAPKRVCGTSSADGGDAGFNGTEARDAKETTRDKTRRKRQFEIHPPQDEEKDIPPISAERTTEEG